MSSILDQRLQAMALAIKAKLDAIVDEIDPGLRADIEAGRVALPFAGVRDQLTGDRLYYVRPDGADANNGLANSAAGAFLTLQHAVDYVRSRLDFNGHNVTIQVADGTYNTGVSIAGPHIGQGDLYLIGNMATPASCTVSTNANGAHCFATFDGARLITRGFKVVTAGANSHGYIAYTNSHMNIGACEFGSVTGNHIECGSNAIIEAYGAPHIISGGASAHFHVGSDGEINCGAFEATITGNPTFTAYFAGVRSGRLDVRNFTWTGTVNASAYVCHQRGVIDGHPGIPNPLPGTPGRTATGGIVVGSVVFPVDVSSDALPAAVLRFGAWDTDGGFFKPLLLLTSGNTPALTVTANGNNVFENASTFSAPDAVIANAGAGNTAASGWTFYNFNSGRCFDAQQFGGPIGYLQRRGNDGPVLVFVDNQGDQVGSIAITTVANTTTYNTSSDYRLKEDPQPLTGALERINAINVYDFAWRKSGVRSHGCYAHELAEVLPQAVTGEKDATDEEGSPIYQGVDWSKVVPDLVAAVQELSRRQAA